IINRENVEWLIARSGIDFHFDMVVIDELSSFKSHQSKRFKSLMKVRPNIKRIVGLTGTPSSNGLWTYGRSTDYLIWVKGLENSLDVLENPTLILTKE